MTFSIITVCYNAEKTIRDTIESVINQTNKDFEYIIKDGMSTDRTLEIIEEYRLSGNIRLISEADKGIYNAMNEAVNSAKGDYIFFLNSADVLADEKVLEDISKVINEAGDTDLLYGNMLLYGNGKEELVSYASKRELRLQKIVRGLTVCHQVIFAKARLLKERPFDESYIYWADQDWLAYWLSNKIKVTPIERIISKYDATGVSSDRNNLDVIRQESDRIARKYAPLMAMVLIPVKRVARLMMKVFKVGL